MIWKTLEQSLRQVYEMKVVVQLPIENSWDFESRLFEAQFRHRDPKPGEWSVLESLKPLYEKPQAQHSYLHKGFLDSHLHMTWLGRHARSLQLDRCKTLKEFQEVLEKSSPDTDRILRAYGWDEGLLKLSLDDFVRQAAAIIPENKPLIAFRVCSHSAFVNKKLQKQLGLNFNSVFVKDRELKLVFEKLPSPTEVDCQKDFNSAQQKLLQSGISSVGDMSLDETTFESIKNLALKGELLLDVQGVIHAGSAPSLESQGPVHLINSKSLGPWDRPAHFSVRHCKRFLDGSLGSRTAWLSQAYDDAETFGENLFETDELLELSKDALYSGFLLSFHVIGDAALDQALEVGEKLKNIMLSRMASDSSDGLFKSRHRLEHVQIVRPEQLKKISEQNLWTLCLQPHHRISDQGFIKKRLGLKRLQENAYPAGIFVREKIPLALSSDAPVDIFDPVTVIKSTIQVGSPAPVLTFDQALWYYTTGSRRALGLDPGRIGPGSTVFLSNAAQ